MANEITVTQKLSCTNGNLNFAPPTKSFKVDQSAIGGPTPGYVTIGTSEESIAFSELGTVGWLMMENLDATNYVEWGFATTVYGGRLEPGESASFRLNPSTTLYIKANSAACKCIINALED